MKRNCDHIITSPDGKRAVYVDSENKDAIKNYWNQDERHKEKFKFITTLILQGLSSKRHYSKVEINDKCKNVTEMRFFVGQENDRIYCKEIRSSKGIHVVVAAILHEHKATETLSSKEKSLIEKVGGYNYEL